MTRTTACLLGPLLLLSACHAAAEPPPAAALAPGDHELSLQHRGRERFYAVHVPPRAAGRTALPVVLNFHGAGSNGRQHREYTAMDGLADREGFLAVYPDGIGRLHRHLLTWNAGGCCGYAAEQGGDDVGFAVAVLTDLAARTPVDRKRVYATGMSNGGMMAHRLAAEVPERIAAVAPVAGPMVVEEIDPAHPVSVQQFHSVDDPRAPYGGALLPRNPWRRWFPRYAVTLPPVEETIERWVRSNGCPPEPRVGPVVRSTAPEGDVAQTALKFVYGPCREGTEVVLWRLGGVGHVWPGAPPLLEWILGPATQVVDASEEMWRFFQRFSRPDAPPLDAVGQTPQRR